MNFFYHFGRYLMMLRLMLRKPENGRMYWEETVRQMSSIGLGSVGIVAFVAVFMGVFPLSKRCINWWLLTFP